MDAASATKAATIETENNYLSVRQVIARKRELAECDSAACQLGVLAKYQAIDTGQDALVIYGVGKGAVGQVYADVKGLIELVSHPGDSYNALKGLATDPEVRAELGRAVMADVDAKIATIERAMLIGGKDNSIAARQAIGEVAVTLASAATGIGGLAKAGVAVSH